MLRRKEHKYITARINTYKIKERNRLVEFRFKAPPGTTSSSITTNTSSGQRNCASWESQPQKSVTFLPCPGGRTTKSTKRVCGGIGGEKNSSILEDMTSCNRFNGSHPSERQWCLNIEVSRSLKKEFF